MSDIEPSDGEKWHPYWAWEEVKHNMWGDVSHRKTWLDIVVSFTGNASLYGEWMRRVVHEWPVSCEHSLTKTGDKRAWMGHAAVALAIGCPEDIVREAWGLLTDEQRKAANEEAAKSIELWRSNHA
jgi:hypothetical protein